MAHCTRLRRSSRPSKVREFPGPNTGSLSPAVVRSALLVSLCTLAAACGDRRPDAGVDAEVRANVCDADAARTVVERLGEQLKRVALLASDDRVESELRQEYGELVTPELLDAWVAHPASAPGRHVSSPWPERIEVSTVTRQPDGCRVAGDVIYLTSADPAAVRRERVVFSVQETAGWRITAYEVAGASEPASDSTDTDGADATADVDAAAGVIEQYYAAINAREFRRAYALWSGDGAASDLSFDAFAAGFAETAQVQVETGAPGRIEGAAGSRYVTVPVVIRARTTDGTRQQFTGSYTLRRSVVDGATEAQRAWRIHTADIALEPSRSGDST